VEEVGHSEADEAGGGEPDLPVIPPILQPIHNIPHMLQLILNPRLRRRRNTCKRS
jgi:hypothetical protein